MMQATPVVYKLESNNDYQIEMESLEALVTDKTKMIVLTHPNNPTTTVYSKESLEAIRTIDHLFVKMETSQKIMHYRCLV